MMAALLPNYPDAEKVFRDLLTPLARTVTQTDEGETFASPVIQVQRVGGSDDGLTDRPRMEIACFAADRHDAWNLAETVRQTVLAAGGTKVNGVLVDKTVTETPAQQLPDLNRDVRKVVALYRAAFRRPRLPTP
jgi:hypothetical protein